MSTADEEPYSTIFASLKHPIRRRILRMLSRQPMSFMEMVGVLGVSNSFLTYHLDNLGELIGKMEDGKYRLSSFGEAAMSTMTKVEDIPATLPHQSLGTGTKKILGKNATVALGIICVLLVAALGGAITYYMMAVNNKNSQLNTLTNEKNQLQTWLDGNETLLNQAQANSTNLQNHINRILNATGDTFYEDLFHDKFGNVSLVSPNYNFSPPISMYQALIIALEYGGWGSSSLSDNTVSVQLDYVKFYNNSALTGVIFEPLTLNVTQPPANYYPVQVNGTTYRYVWAISITPTHPPRIGVVSVDYQIDAATGEIVSAVSLYQFPP
jgi:hypothetical protein